MLFSLNQKSKADAAAPRCREGLKRLSLPTFNLPILSLGLCCCMLPRWLFYLKPSICGPGRKKKEGKENGQRRKARGREEGLCDEGKHFPQLSGRFFLSWVSGQEMGFMATPSCKGVGDTAHFSWTHCPPG